MVEVVLRRHLLKEFGLPKEPYDDMDLQTVAGMLAVRFEYIIDRQAKLFVEAASERDETTLNKEDPVRRAFAEAFEFAWARICETCRSALMAFWKANAPNGCPPIELSDVALAGGYNWLACSFTFSYKAVELAIRDKVLVDLIGHELGHAWWHTRTPNCHLTRNDLEGQDEAKEVEANVQARRWGFDMGRLLQWGNDNREALGYPVEFPENFLGPENVDAFVPYVADPENG